MSAEAEGRREAEKFREKHQLGIAPIEDIVALMDLVDVDVVCVESAAEEHGYTARDPKTGVVVFVVNSSLPYVRFRSTLAHELCHYLVSDDLSSTRDHPYSGRSESRAHAFARHLLLPLAAVKSARQTHASYSDEQLLNWCVRRYGLSPQMSAYQLKNARLIGTETCDEFSVISGSALAAKYGWSDLLRARDASVSVARKPRRLQEKATQAYLSGKMPLNELAVITGRKASELREELPAPQAAPSLGDNNFLDLGDDDLSDLP